MSNYDLFDVWRIQHPSERQFTWRQKNPLKHGRLDFFLISSGLLNMSISSSISYGYRTDHSLINLSLKLSDITPGRGYWKFNNSLLFDSDFASIIEGVIFDTINDYACIPHCRDNMSSISHTDINFIIDDQLFFEILLLNIRGNNFLTQCLL